MDRQKFSTIAHQDHEFYSPLSSGKIDRVLGLIPLKARDRVIDVGCGRAEMLIRLCENTNAQGVGVDLNPAFIELAETNAETRIQKDQITWHSQPIEDIAFEPASFAAALCIGSTHAFGNLQNTIEKLSKMVRPGGHILVGEGYWKTSPSQEYLDVLGATIDDYGTHADNVFAGAAAGLIPLYSVVSNEDEWDHYEGLYARAMELYLYANPDDPDADTMQTRIRNWRETYLSWGRSTLGFGLYLFLNP